jgi:hypothetical protein
MAYGDLFTGGRFPARRFEVLSGPGWLDSDRYDISTVHRLGQDGKEIAAGLALRREKRQPMPPPHSARD